VDVVFGAVEAAHLARRVEIGRDSAVHPTPLAVRILADAFVFDVLAALRAPQHGTQERCHVRRHHFERALAVDLVLRLAHPVCERLVHELVMQALVEVSDRTRDVVGEEAHLRLLRFQRIADLDVVFDVREYGERSADAPAHFALGEERDLHPAQIAIRLALAALVGNRRARERALDVALHLGQRVRRQELLERMAEQIVRRDADPVGRGPVREAKFQLPVEVQDRQTDAVGHQTQPLLTLPGFELQPLQMIDVAVRDEEPADQSRWAAVRVVVDADPDRGPGRRHELPLEPGALAGERCFHIRVVQLVDVAADDFDDLAADHFVRLLAEPLHERLVDEAIALTAINVGERRAEGVQLALGEREQRLPLARIAHRLRNGGELEPVERSCQRHGIPMRRWSVIPCGSKAVRRSRLPSSNTGSGFKRAAAALRRPQMLVTNKQVSRPVVNWLAGA